MKQQKVIVFGDVIEQEKFRRMEETYSHNLVGFPSEIIEMILVRQYEQER
jgi:hypothetical protein